jgi:hypothetical protein
MSYNPTWKKINPPSESMRDYYASLFKRNQMKFMRRSILSPEHIGSEFVYDGLKYKLIGTGTPVEMIVENLEDGSCYMVHCDLVTKAILEN